MFRPSLHGWPFPNEYSCSGPELGIGGPPPPELGLGGGFCWAALDRYLRGAPIERDAEAPEPGDPLHTELVQRQVAALGRVRDEIRQWQESDDGSWRDRLPVPVGLGGRDLASRTRAGWRAVRRRLDGGEPVLLTLLGAADPYDRPRSIRQLLATGWERSGRRVMIHVYDPDEPDDDDFHLAFNLAGALDARLTGGARVRGFLAVPYDRSRRPVIRTEAFDNRSVIGLNRPVRGEPHPAFGGKHIDLVARNERGALLHFRRRRGHHWEGVNVTEAGSFGASELHSDPTAFHRLGVLHVFARSYTGDLLHFRHFRSWSLTNRTDHKRIGPRFRLEGEPVVVSGPGLHTSVLGRDESGGLVHYRSSPLRGWRAEQVPGDPVADDPQAALAGDTLHVVALGADGRLLHWVDDESWTMTDTDAGPGPEIRLVGRPWLDVSEGQVRVFVRTRDDDLVALELGDDGTWQRTGLAPDLSGDPAATMGPGGIHVFAPTVQGGLVHAWRTDGAWTSEDVVASRPTLEERAPGPAEVAAWGSSTTLRVLVRRGSRLRTYDWTPDADWVTDPVTDRAGARPIIFRDALGDPHAIFTDRRGTIVHVETGDWKEPARAGAGAAAAEPDAAEPDAAEPAPEEPEAADEGADDDVQVAAGEALEAPEAMDLDGFDDLEAAAEPDTMEDVDAPEDVDWPEEMEAEEVAAMDEADPVEADAADGSELDSELEDPDEEDVPPLPLLEDPADWDDPESGADAESDGEPDFGRDRRMAPAAGPASDPEEPESEEREPARALDEAPEDESAEQPEEEPARREFMWEDRRTSASPDRQVEPMDLSLLDSWPPSARDRRRSRRKDSPTRQNGSKGDES